MARFGRAVVGSSSLFLPLIVSSCLALLATPARAQSATPGPCVRGKLPGGALSLVCIPTQGWNGDVLFWAHGYTRPHEPLDFQHIRLDDGTYLPELTQKLGFAFATTSYRMNGLAILPAIQDMRQLSAAFDRAAPRPPRHRLLAGASEGGLVVLRLMERAREFDGAFSLCGPIGSFREQLDHLGDFRALYDYFFPGVLPGSSVEIPQALIADWEEVYKPAVLAAARRNPRALAELISTAKAAVEPADSRTFESRLINLLEYNVFATNDAVAKLGGSPYDNRNRWYWGSSDDARLNRAVRRYAASPGVREKLARYETSGRLQGPVVSLHTVDDEIVPYWHQLLYYPKLSPFDWNDFAVIPAPRYGHCNFTQTEILTAFFGLVVRVRAESLLTRGF